MLKIHKNTVLTACILAALGIAIGAFGAHGVKNLVSEQSLAVYVTGTHYHMYHALALLGLGIIPQISTKTRKSVYWFFLSGIIFFSGSLYLLAFKELLLFNTSILGPVTPLGGLFFILGWLRLAYGVIKS